MPDNTNAYTIVQGIGNNGTERLRVSSNGKVGIGTDNPQRLLEIFGTDSDAAAIQLSSGTNNRDKARFIKDNQDDGRALTIQSNSGNSNSAIVFVTNGLTSGEKVRIAGNGNVGIGTDDPQANLH